MIEIEAGNDNITSANFDYVMGDKTGYIHIQDGQTMYVEYKENSVVRSFPPTNFHVDYGSELWLPADFKVYGTQVPAFKVVEMLLQWRM